MQANTGSFKNLFILFTITVGFVSEATALTPTPTPLPSIVTVSRCKTTTKEKIIAKMIRESITQRLTVEGYQNVKVRGKLRRVATEGASPAFVNVSSLEYVPGFGDFAGKSPSARLLYQPIITPSEEEATVANIQFNIDGFLNANPQFKERGGIPVSYGPLCVNAFVYLAKISMRDIVEEKKVQIKSEFSTQPFGVSGNFTRVTIGD